MALLCHAKARGPAHEPAANSSPCGPEIRQYSRHVCNLPIVPFHSTRLLLSVSLHLQESFALQRLGPTVKWDRERRGTRPLKRWPSMWPSPFRHSQATTKPTWNRTNTIKTMTVSTSVLLSMLLAYIEISCVVPGLYFSSSFHSHN